MGRKKGFFYGGYRPPIEKNRVWGANLGRFLKKKKFSKKKTPARFFFQFKKKTGFRAKSLEQKGLVKETKKQ
ncbi:hypothetical protein DNR41_27560, partial [Escherichia coli]